jgi:hypothetical protein
MFLNEEKKEYLKWHLGRFLEFLLADRRFGIAYSILIFFIIILTFQILFPGKIVESASKAENPGDLKDDQEINSLVKEVNSLLSREKFIYRRNDRRDPFNPLVKKEGKLSSRGIKKSSSLALQGTLGEAPRALAIIRVGAQIFYKREGEEVIPGVKILEIRKGEVVLEENGQRRILTYE